MHKAKPYVSPATRQRQGLAARRQRMVIANEVIAQIAATGPRWFCHGERVSRFEVADDGRIFWVDSSTWRWVPTAAIYDWPGFSGNATLQALCRDLATYIRTGRQIRASWFFPDPISGLGGMSLGYRWREIPALRQGLQRSIAMQAIAERRHP